MSYTYFSSWPGAASPPDRLVDRMGWDGMVSKRLNNLRISCSRIH